jgi:hypothetical protein
MSGALLDVIGALRNEGAVRKTDGLRWELSVPHDDYARLVAGNPALNSRDAAEKTAAWLAFMRSPESAPYRVREYRGRQ